MFWSLLLVLPLLAGTATSDNAGCSLPDPSNETFFMTTAEKPWYQQYQYKVPGLWDLGCVTYVQSPGNSSTEMNLVGNFSKAPLAPMSSYVSVTGNKLDKTYDDVWQSILSGPYNIVYSHEEFIMDHYCFLGYDSLKESVSVAEVAQFFTTVKEPSDELLAKIWEVIDNHPEVDRSKFVKVIC